MIRGVIAPKKFNKEGLEFRINQMSFLRDVAVNKIDNITLSIPLPALTEALVKELVDITSADSGTVLLKFDIFDPANNHQIKLFSRSKKITLSNDFIKYLEETPDVSFTINNVNN